MAQLWGKGFTVTKGLDGIWDPGLYLGCYLEDMPLMDNGHYHPTEVVSDRIPALLAFFQEIAFHITRPIRWDSDHVVLFDDETKEICREIVRCGVERVNIALDYFDASINRVSAWTVGFRNLQKALLSAGFSR